MNDTTTDSARKFLTEIFEPNGATLDHGRIAVWNKTTHQTRLAADPEEAASFTKDPSWRNLSYFGVCTRDRAALRARATKTGKPLHSIQGEKPELAGMPGVWVDIDVRAPGHKKASLAPTVDAAIAALAKAVPIVPTITVRTGGGIHAYWLFKEGVHKFTASGTNGAREPMEMLVRSFQAMVRNELKSRGWSDDQTWALPRVMRLPGGQNTSHGEPRDVTWEMTGPRYTHTELWDVVPKNLELVEPTKVEHNDDRLRFEIRPITVSERAVVQQFIDSVCDIDEEFERVWLRKRRSLPSQSEMDLSIATRLAAGNTPTQMIVDALRIHRIDGGANPSKADRADYYLGVLQMALGATDEDRRRHALIEKVETLKAESATGAAVVKIGDDGEETKLVGPLAKVPQAERAEVQEEALAVVNEAFGLKDNKRLIAIARETLDSGRNEDWRFIWPDGLIRAVRGQDLAADRVLRNEVFLATGVQTKPFTTKPNKPRQWSPVIQAIFLAANSAGAETEMDSMLSSLVRYVERIALSGSERLAAPFSAPWHAEIQRSGHVALWKSKGGEPGVLVRLDAWVESLAMDPLGPKLSPSQQRGWTKFLVTHCDWVERVPAVSFLLEDGETRRTRRGYIRLRRPFFEQCGSDDLAKQLDRVVQEAPTE